MKKGIVLLVIFSFGLFFTTPISAQRIYKTEENQNLVKVPVKYKSIDAFSDGNGVWLEWETSFESGNLGFYVYRSNGIEKELISSSLIPGIYLKMRDARTIGEKYTFFDADGAYNSTYYIETYNISGQKQFSNSFSPKFVSDLTDVAGSSSAVLKKASQSSNAFVLNDEANLPEEIKEKFSKTLSRSNAATQRFVAAQAGVKIGVKKEGFYRVTRSELQTAGFDVNSSSTNWQLYKNGVEQAVIIGANGAYIEFYGNGLDTKDSDTQIYFLINGAQNGKRIESFISRAFGGRGLATGYSQSTTYKERTNYFSDLRNGDGVDNFFGRVINSSPVTINLNLPAVDFSVADASFDITIQGLTFVPHQTRVVLNGTEIGIVTGSNLASMSKHFDIPTSVLREGANTLQLTTLAGASDISFFDTVKINYSRKFLARQNQLSFFVPSYKESYVDGFTSPNIRIFDISNPDQPKIIPNLAVESNNAGGYRAYLAPNRTRAMFGVEDTGLLSAASVATNSPSSLSNVANSANMIIISYKDWMTQANDWANYRRGQGLSVEVVDVEDVYDEFSFGVFSSDAIKNFLQYAYNNRQTKPDYVLLIGDATYNPRNYTSAATPPVSYNFVPTKMVETIYLETGSDEALADFNNDGLAEIPIGRIPVNNFQTVIDVLNKVIIYESTVSTQNLNRGVLFASDLPRGYDFAGVNNRLRTQLPTNTPTVMINKGDADARTKLLAEMNAGKFLVNYSGHGNTSAWSASPTFFGNSDAAALTNGNNLTIFTMLTCLNGYFVQTPDSLAEVLLKKPAGGAVAVWASSGETTPDIQEIMARRFFNKIGENNTMRLGDLIKDAKTTIPGGRDVRLSWALIGDPALKVR